MAEAMARMEGFFNVQESLARKNHNPGNLRTWGSAPQIGGYAMFATDVDGWLALKQQIRTNIFGKVKGDPYPLRGSDPMNFLEFYAGQRDSKGDVRKGGYPGYAPSADKNDPGNYARYVFGKVRAALKLSEAVTVETPIREICEG